jgi:molecular chaperone GrpE
MTEDRPNEGADLREEPAEGKESGASEADAERRIAELEEDLAGVKDRLLRSLAEQENIRRRAERDREDAVRYAASELVRDLLITADNLRRAIESVPGEDALNEQARQLLTGVEATERVLLDAFERNGIRRIDPLGQPFDPNLHQAMFEVEEPGRPAGTVVQVLQPGYLYHDRLLRPAMVAVAKDESQAMVDAGTGTGESPRDDTAS